MSQPNHHEVFSKFKCWEGFIEAGIRVNFLGVKTRDYMARTEKVHGPPDDSSRNRIVATSLPAFDEEYFEWIQLLEAVTRASDLFTMVELGAGHGRWMVNAAAALRTLNGPPYKLIGVEPEPTHFQWMKQHIRDNGVEESSCQLIEAAVDAKDGKVKLIVGDPSSFYGQYVFDYSKMAQKVGSLGLLRFLFARRVKTVKAVSLNTLLRPLDKVDFIDLDVQGAEFAILESDADQIDKKVRRIHVGTHGHEIECSIRSLFQQLGWKNQFDYSSNGESSTPWGDIRFQDGVQSWNNPNLNNL